MMSVIGALGLAFILCGAIAAVPEYLITKSRAQFMFLVPFIVFPMIPAEIPPPPPGFSVRVVQPAFDMERKMDGRLAETNINEMAELSRRPFTGGGRPDLIVWPETSWPYIIGDLGERLKIPRLGAPVVVGGIYWNDDKWYNAMFLLDKNGGIGDVYLKRHLTPFGERWPILGGFIPLWQLSAGPGAVRAIGNFAPAICYEIVFSDSLVAGDPDFILNTANDVWIGNSPGIPQNIDMVRRQAIESGLPVIRANNSGISALVDARGNVIKTLAFGERGVLDVRIPPKRATVYRKIGLNGIMILILALCVLIMTPRRWREPRPSKRRPRSGNS
jgi:apolipoprotein N-acyltransferase